MVTQSHFAGDAFTQLSLGKIPQQLKATRVSGESAELLWPKITLLTTEGAAAGTQY